MQGRRRRQAGMGVPRTDCHLNARWQDRRPSLCRAELGIQRWHRRGRQSRRQRPRRDFERHPLAEDRRDFPARQRHPLRRHDGAADQYARWNVSRAVRQGRRHPQRALLRGLSVPAQGLKQERRGWPERSQPMTKKRIISKWIKGGSHQASAIAFSIAESAAPALAPSGPPACAMSGRPPPPLPPSTCEATRARSTALKREVRSLVTPTTTPALPSPVTPTMATTPLPSCFLPSSARLLRSFISMPSTERANSFTSPTSRTPAAPAATPLAAEAPPPIASFLRASARSRSSFLRS